MTEALSGMRRLLPIVLGIELAACSMAPRYSRPQLPVPPETPVGPAYFTDEAMRDTTSLAETGWTDFFTDPRLRGVIRIALSENRDLRLALANVERARAEYRVQRADLLPSVTGAATATYQKTPLGQIPGAGVDISSGSGKVDVYSLRGSVPAWELDLFGRVRNLTKAAQEQFFAVEDNRKALELTLIAEVAIAWLTLAADLNRLAVARKTEAAFLQTVALTRARSIAGVSSELDVLQARTSHDRAMSDIATLTSQVAQDQNALTLLAGTTIPAELLPDRLPECATLDRLPGRLASEVLLRRPDVSAAEHRLRAANANVGAARAAFFPRISLTAALGTISLGLSNLLLGSSEDWSLTGTPQLPIFNSGRNAAHLDSAKALRHAMVAQYEKTVQAAFRETADALARHGTIKDKLEAQRAFAANTTAINRLSEARFGAGLDGFLRTLDSQRAQYAAEMELVNTRLIKETNAVELYRTLGGQLK